MELNDLKNEKRKLTSSFNIALLFTKIGGFLPLRFDGDLLHAQPIFYMLSGIFFVLVVSGYISNIILTKNIYYITFQELINIMLDLAQFFGSLCCFINAVIRRNLIKNCFNKSFLICKTLDFDIPSVWKVVIYIAIEVTEVIHPPSGIFPAIGKLQAVSAIATLAILMIIQEKSLEHLNQQMENLYTLLQGQPISQKLYIYRNDPSVINYSESPQGINWNSLQTVLRDLQVVQQELNSIAILVLVPNVTRCCYLFTIHLFRLISRRFPFSEYFWTYLSFQPIFFLCKRFESIQIQAVTTKNLLNELDLSLLDKRSQAQVRLLILQTENYSWKLSPLGLFNMDFSLVLSIIMTTLTYVILLKQMIGKQMESNL